MYRKLIIEASYTADESVQRTVIPVGRVHSHDSHDETSVQQFIVPPMAIFPFRADVASCFLSEIWRSKLYRRLVWDSLTAGSPFKGSQTFTVKILLDPVDRYPLDYRLYSQTDVSRTFKLLF